MTDPEGAGMTVLIAEDSAATALLARALLTGWGFAVHVTGCDDTAVQAMTERHFDLVIIGTTAPGAGLVEAACDSTPILALVSRNNRRPQANAELILPLTAAALRDAVRQCLGGVAAVLDSDAIEALWGGPDSQVYHRIIRVFIEETRGRMARIADLIAAGDRAAITIEAHSIKGAAANVCARGIRDAAARLEAQPEQPALFDALRNAVDAGIAALERLLP